MAAEEEIPPIGIDPFMTPFKPFFKSNVLFKEIAHPLK